LSRSPLHYPILVEQAELLRRLYGEVLIPDSVAAELLATASPAPVLEWISAHPRWLRVMEVASGDIALISDELDLGERAAIALAEKTPNGWRSDAR
jgi:predicted nucleic acid-binding protein